VVKRIERVSGSEPANNWTANVDALEDEEMPLAAAG
jgi:hypothetical protein